MKTLAIHGFGRIGRSILRASLQERYRDKLAVRAICDTAQGEILSYLLAHDSTHGAFPHALRYENGALHIAGVPTPIRLLQEDSEFSDIDIVIESSGRSSTSHALREHLARGAKRVLLTCSPSDDTPSFVLGGNLAPNAFQVSSESPADSNALHALRHAPIFSSSSCTATALAPLCRVIESHFGIEMASLCITHSFTNDQPLLDSAITSDKRRARAAASNIIPTSTGVVRALESLLPQLHGRLSGHSVRVPVSNVLLLDVSLILHRSTTLEALNSAMRESAQGAFAGIIGLDEDYGVSSDFIGNPHSVVVAPDLTSLLQGKMARVLAWCDNEWGYANRVLDLALLA